MISRGAAHAALTAAALGFVAATFFFGAWPESDLWVSARFAIPSGHFPAESNAWLELFRQVLWDVTNAGILVSFAMMTLQGLFRPAHRIATRVWSFIFLSYLIAPGLIVNGLLKTYWGRARPRQIEAFGGDAAFTQALNLAHECARNCSFVSGEAAGILTTAMVLSLTFIPNLEPRIARWSAGLMIWALALSGAAIRIAMGAHFLSDVVFSFLICAMVTLALYLALAVDRHVLGATPANLLRDLGSMARPVAAFLQKRAPRVF